jgi:hypothetical protein
MPALPANAWREGGEGLLQLARLRLGDRACHQVGEASGTERRDLAIAGSG